MLPTHILLTTDLSDESVRSLGPIAEIARKLGARITLLHVVADTAMGPVGPLGTPPIVPNLAESTADARARLEELRAELPSELLVEVAVEIGPTPAETICRYAEQDEHEVDYIAMATHGRAGLRRLVMGSVAEDLLRRTDKPMLVCPIS